MEVLAQINAHVHHVMCKTLGNILFNFILVSIISECLRPFETLSIDENKLLYECKVLWNKIVKGIKNFVFRGFDIIMNI
jgi:hypothetical protein